MVSIWRGCWWWGGSANGLYMGRVEFCIDVGMVYVVGY